MKLTEKLSADVAAEGNRLLWIALACSVGLHLGATVGLASWRNGNRHLRAPVYGVAATASAPGEFVELELESVQEGPETADVAATPASPVEEPSPDSVAASLPPSDFSDAVEPPSAATPTIREKPASAAAAASRNSVNAQRKTPRAAAVSSSQHVAHNGVTKTATSSGAGGTGGAGANVSRGPAYLNNAPPFYPPHARQAGQQGLVLLWVAVSERGSVADLRLQRSSGFPELDAAAVGAVRSWRFRPAIRGEVPVPAAIRVPVRFRLDQ